MEYKVSATLERMPAFEAVRLLLEIRETKSRGIVAFVPDNNYGRRLKDSLTELLSIPNLEVLDDILMFKTYPIFFPARESSIFTEDNCDIVNVCERILARRQWNLRSADKKDKLVTIFILPITVLLEKLEPFSVFLKREFYLEKFRAVSPKAIEERLEYLGYKKVSRVTDLGQYSLRGTILDVFSSYNASPVRMEFSEEKISSLRTFSIEDQKSVSELLNFRISAVTERAVDFPVTDFVSLKLIPEIRSYSDKIDISTSKLRLIEEQLKEGVFFPGSEAFLISIARNFVGILDALEAEKQTFLIAIDDCEAELYQCSEILKRDYEMARTQGFLVPNYSECYFDVQELKEAIGLCASGLGVYADTNNLKLIEEITISSYEKGKTEENGVIAKFLYAVKKYVVDSYIVVIAVGLDQRRSIIQSALTNANINYRELYEFNDIFSINNQPANQNVFLLLAPLPRGFLVAKDKLVVFSEYEVFHVRTHSSRKLPFKRSNFRMTISSLSQLCAGDVVVHELYGIGKFLGLKKIEKNEQRGEFLEIEYADNTKLFVPIYDFLRVGKYQGAEAIPPALTQLGSGKWEAAKQKIRNEIASLTANLLKTYAVRALLKGYSFCEKTEDEQIFANTFEYVETEDQAKAISDVLTDMESEKPMDRLVCGDVGYGKTEVAMRAAFKAVNSGKQVAIVAPTTLLVDQHHANFLERFNQFGFEIGVVNRFRSKADIKETLEKLTAGKIDIIIGTHRLLQKDIDFLDLGLVVIDEEHKFGVAQKERLKHFRMEVDVLTLSATPIPRTLQQALHGTRELSVIETAPIGRRTVAIRVDRYSKELLQEAIDRELLRGGQVFIVQHLIAGMHEVLDLVRQLNKGVVCEMAHGKMKGEELEGVMQRFYSGEIKVLVSTAIIDSGIDVSNANTIVVLNPQDFGLAQLYQLRGRVGRGDRRATAYFLYDNYAKLTDDAKRRLAVIESQATEGNGFKLALQDMEIRGAGSLFGKDQSGHAQVLGYDMYFKILEEAVSVEKKRRGISADNSTDFIIKAVEPELNLGVDLLISDELIPDIQERLIFYQRSLDIDSIEVLTNFIEEFRDRFGVLTESVENFLSYMLLRNYCMKLLISRLNIVDGAVTVSVLPESKFYSLIKDVNLSLIKLSSMQFRFRVDGISRLVKIFTSII